MPEPALMQGGIYIVPKTTALGSLSSERVRVCI